MQTLKRLFSITFITLLVFTAFSVGFTKNYPVFGASSEWEAVNNSDLVKAFQAYCKSRDLTIEGSALDAITSMTTKAFDNICRVIGISNNDLQAHIKKATDGNSQLQFLFDSQGISFYNRIFAQFLQDYDLEVGDTADEQNNTIYDGKLFNDNGNKNLIYIVQNLDIAGGSATEATILQYGTNYIYSSTYYSDKAGQNVTFNIQGADHTYKIQSYYINANSAYGVGYNYVPFYFDNGNNMALGGFSFAFNLYDNKLYFVYYSKTVKGQVAYINKPYTRMYKLFALNNVEDQLTNVTIYLTTNNETINNNDYSDNSHTVINNEGDVYNYDSEDEPDPPTGGGGTDGPSDDSPTMPDWGIELPDFDNDWFISGLEKKFPWDIPFNIMFMFSLFSAEPEAPHFEGDIDLKIYKWHYDIDLAPFENIAHYFRLFFFLYFLLQLMLLTKTLIWG